MTELLAPPPEVIEGNELEEFADEYVASQFSDLYKTDLFMLDLLKGNPNAWDQRLEELLIKWAVPIEDAQDQTLPGRKRRSKTR